VQCQRDLQTGVGTSIQLVQPRNKVVGPSRRGKQSGRQGNQAGWTEKLMGGHAREKEKEGGKAKRDADRQE